MKIQAVFFLHHDTDKGKFIGTFRQKPNAEKCITKYKQPPSLKDFPKGFVRVVD